ncbi:hypothetical protein F7734_10040 [Scytonema sp. UIC 10036]|uniref:hypothetical protein n=1 Tax=Scytonema sp. UIC 10036 TaxID=2304196 RepID=UPI0012DADB44|nr:hypothetical protein [Scytonema sp. UIC 10036]MUG92771.1 hypothetical protein [Scytonema sp. UIC 10036]
MNYSDIPYNNPLPNNSEENPVIYTYDSPYFADTTCYKGFRNETATPESIQRLEDAKAAVGDSLSREESAV